MNEEKKPRIKKEDSSQNRLVLPADFESWQYTPIADRTVKWQGDTFEKMLAGEDIKEDGEGIPSSRFLNK